MSKDKAPREFWLSNNGGCRCKRNAKQVIDRAKDILEGEGV